MNHYPYPDEFGDECDDEWLLYESEHPYVADMAREGTFEEKMRRVFGDLR